VKFEHYTLVRNLQQSLEVFLVPSGTGKSTCNISIIFELLPPRRADLLLWSIVN